jgi:hypothetical protein
MMPLPEPPEPIELVDSDAAFDIFQAVERELAELELRAASAVAEAETLEAELEQRGLDSEFVGRALLHLSAFVADVEERAATDVVAIDSVGDTQLGGGLRPVGALPALMPLPTVEPLCWRASDALPASADARQSDDDVTAETRSADIESEVAGPGEGADSGTNADAVQGAPPGLAPVEDSRNDELQSQPLSPRLFDQFADVGPFPEDSPATDFDRVFWSEDQPRRRFSARPPVTAAIMRVVAVVLLILALLIRIG